MSTHRERFRIALVLLALLSAAPTVAQVGNSNPAALGLADNYTALAQSVHAPAWNPAVLGLAEDPGIAFTILPLRAQAGLDPVSHTDLAAWNGTLVPDSVREAWLTRIEANGGEKGAFGVDVTEFAFSMSRFAFSFSTSVRGRVNLSPAFAELFLFGNAGRTGDPEDYSFEDNTFDIAATSTGAVSFGVPLEIPGQRFAVGATLKYTVGHLFVTGADNGSVLTADPVGVDLLFPVAVSDTALGQGNRGSGFGVDIGAAWSNGMVDVGATIQNVINTFAWSLGDLYFYQGRAVFNADTSYTEFEEAQPFDAAPERLKERVTDLHTFDPILAAGAAVHVLPYLTVTGDVRHQLGESLQVGARSHLGVGAQLTILPTLPVRAGLSLVSGGFKVGGGIGAHLGPIDLDIAGALGNSDAGSETAVALGLTVTL